MPAPRFKLLALDVDGTLLDSEGLLRPRTRAAVARARSAGMLVILCTGRRYRRARPIADELLLDSPLVCNSGAIIKDPRDHSTRWRADFEPILASQIHELFQEHREPIVVYRDHAPDEHDFVVSRFPTECAYFNHYVERNQEHIRVDPEIHASTDEIFHVCAVGTVPEMTRFEQLVHERLNGSATTCVQRGPRYRWTMCEILRHDANKWTALEQIARERGIAKEAICAIGDDANDLAMIQGAGLGVAMAHAPSDIRAHADHVAESHEDALAEFIENQLLA